MVRLLLQGDHPVSAACIAQDRLRQEGVAGPVHPLISLLAVSAAVLGCDAPFLAGIVEPLPQAGRSSVGRDTILVVTLRTG